MRESEYGNRLWHVAEDTAAVSAEYLSNGFKFWDGGSVSWRGTPLRFRQGLE
jgi:hypothetical protein